MDLTAAIKQFFDADGNITLDPRLSLATLSEMLYAQDVAHGGGDRHVLRYWDYSESREGVTVDFTRTQVNTRIKAVAGRLQHIATPGDRVAILANNSPEYLFGFMGALYAGLVPVPLYDPNEPGHSDHLNAVLKDAQPTIVLTNNRTAKAVRKLFTGVATSERPRILAIDSLPDSTVQYYTSPAERLGELQKAAHAGDAQASLKLHAMMSTPPIDTTAFLQYTSGSTRTPAGVILTNRSIITNVLQIFAAAHLQFPMRLVTWLPLHHDMGIILSAFVIMMGVETDLMAPRDFLQQPSRWVKQMSKRADNEYVYGVVPNFALDLVAAHGMPDTQEEREALDFSTVAGVINGSEPATLAAMTHFLEAFEPHGFVRSALRPSYGLAEASLLVSTPQTPERPVILIADREELAQGKLVAVDTNAENTVPLISNGQVVRPQALIVVDPETRTELPDGHIGELWAHGDNMAIGYLDRPEDTAETFHNRLAGRLEENSRAAGIPDDDRWMATGDLGGFLNNELYITGRLKDLVIVAGRNHYPQDIEATVQAASEHVRPNAVAAFAVTGEDAERLIIIAERADTADATGDAQAITIIREAVTRAHGIRPADIRIGTPGSIARSSSAKIARRVERARYMAEEDAAPSDAE